jgi:hypothetical protein
MLWVWIVFTEVERQSLIDSLSVLMDARIWTNSHCFGCTAGMGSSWQGALATED